jgi:hypothetical protein
LKENLLAVPHTLQTYRKNKTQGIVGDCTAMHHSEFSLLQKQLQTVNFAAEKNQKGSKRILGGLGDTDS